ncbi:MAG: hypothetical protein Q8N51_04570 [Gammaproteobacteria bacterium]|nr:hypothetical protein [Gammaproteobacteria bacterium]
MYAVIALMLSACASVETSSSARCDAAQSCQPAAVEEAPAELTERELDQILDDLEREIEEEP